MSRAAWGALGALVVFGVGVVVGLHVRGADRQVAALQAFADSLQRADSARVAAALVAADSVRRYTDSLQGVAGRVRTVVRTDSATAARLAALVASSRTTRDSLTGLVGQVAALGRQVDSLHVAARLDSLALVAERARGDSLRGELLALKLSNRQLTERIARLRPSPRWVRVSLEAAKLAGAAYAGFRLGRASR